MTADNDKGTPASEQQSPITRETDEGEKIIPGAEITLPEGDEEATITEQEEGAEGEQQQPAAAAQPDKRGKNRVPAKQRINQLWHEARQAETRAEQLERENADLKRQMGEKDTRTAEVNAGAMVAHESSWKNARDLARRELIDAKGAANLEGEANAIAKLSRAEAELANIEAWKSAQPKPKANGAEPPAQPEQRQQQNGNGQAQPQQVQLSPEIQEWVDNNRWMVNDPQNPDFDQEMANYATNQAAILEQRMRRQGRDKEVGTQTYFDEMDRLMREEFPDRFDDTEEPEVPQPKPQPRQQPANQRRAPQMQRQNGAQVAPATASAGQAAIRAQPRTVNLSAEERGFAHQMAANGALRYPVGHKMQGKPMQPADAEVAYARQKLNQTARS